MTYLYMLTKNDLVNIGLQPTEEEKYCVEVSGWTGKFDSIYELIVEKNYGEFKGKIIATGKNITDEQMDYIHKNCACEEY